MVFRPLFGWCQGSQHLQFVLFLHLLDKCSTDSILIAAVDQRQRLYQNPFNIHGPEETAMRKFLSLAAVVAIAACGPKKAETPAVDTTATMAPAPAPAATDTMATPAPADTMARDTAKKM